MHKQTSPVRLAALAVGLLVLTGCGAGTESLPAESTTGVQSSATEVDLTGLRQLSREGELWQIDGATMYVTVPAEKSRGSILQTVDLNTGKRQALCFKKNCTHQNEDCNAWLDCESEIGVFAVAENRLALVYGRYGPLEEQGAEPSAAVELRDRSGAVICPAVPLPTRPASAFYTDGKALYYTWQQTLDESTHALSLMRIALDEDEGFGQVTAAAYWQLPNQISVTEFCTDQGFLAVQWEYRMDGQTQVAQHRALCVAQWDGTVRRIAENADGQSFLITDMGDHAVYRYDSRTGVLEQLDAVTGQVTPFAQLSPGLRFSEGAAGVGDVLLFNTIQEDTTQAWYLQAGGEPVAIQRQTSHNGYLRSAIVRDVLADGRLIIDLGDMNYEESYTDQTGRWITSQTSETLLGVCTPQQYRDGAEDCLMLETNHPF